MPAAEKAFELSVLIHAIDKFSGPMKRIEAQMGSSQRRIDSITLSMRKMGQSADDIQRVESALQRLNRAQAFGDMARDLEKIGMSKNDIAAIGASFEQIGQTQEKLDRLSKTMDKFKTTALVGAGMTAVGVGMAAGLEHAAAEAGKLLTTMTTIQDATGASAKDLSNISQTIRSTSAVTKFGIMDTANFASTLATSGYNGSQVNQLLPVFARFAEVQQYGKGMDPQESIKNAIELAHGFGKYSPAELNSFLNMYNKGTFLQPEDSTVYGETLKYTMTQAKTLGMSDQDTMFMAALANRMGLAGSMGGTNAADMLMRSIPGISGGLRATVDKTTGQVRYPRALTAMMSIGMANAQGNSSLFQNGRIVNLSQFVDQLYTHTKNLTPERRMQVYKDIFGIQGARAAALFGTERGQEQLAALHQGMTRVKSIDQMQADYLQTPEGQINQLKSNLSNLKFNVFLVMAKDLNPFIQNLNKAVIAITKFSDKHPKIAKYIASFSIMATGALLIAGPLTSLIGLIGMFGTGILKLNTRFKLLKRGTSLFKLFGRGFKMLSGGMLRVIVTALKFSGGIIGSLGKLLAFTIRFAIRMAAQWLIAMGPIGWIIGGAIALIALFVLAWRHDLGGIQEWTKKIFHDIAKFFDDLFHLRLGKLPGDMLKLGSDIITGIWHGIEKMGSWFKNTFGNWIKEHIPGPFKKILGIASPSRVFMEHGKFIVQGLAMGITNHTALARDASRRLASSVMNPMARDAMIGAHGGTTNINVYPHKHQRAEDIAELVIRKMGKSTRKLTLNTGSRLVPTAR